MPDASLSSPPPRIGLSTYREPAMWGVWSESADLLPSRYTDEVVASGGVALLLPPGDPYLAGITLDAIDGLILAGGADIDPARYGADRLSTTGAPRPDRDGWEIALVRKAIERDLPVLAICRGMQVLNVALGGGLRQHLPDEVGSQLHCPTVGVHGRHEVSLAAGSIVGRAFGLRADVATYHHQAVDTLGAELQATGWADDGVIEAVELTNCTWVVGVQWHPEAYAGAPIFAALVAAAREQASRRAPDPTGSQS